MVTKIGEKLLNKYQIMEHVKIPNISVCFIIPSLIIIESFQTTVLDACGLIRRKKNI